MFTRRKFLTNSLLGALGLSIGSCKNDSKDSQNLSSTSSSTPTYPIAIATWDHGMTANETAWEILNNGGRALDAVEQGVRIIEADEKGATVGIGGRPDREGKVTLDACIMDEKGNYGAVCFLENIKHPISVARKVMEETPHVILAGEGALQFAKSQGFEEENLLTETSKKAYEKWLVKAEYTPIINIENHDTISMLAIDSDGNISGSCTTSGLAFKMRGRVGDSPIIGSGLYVDNEVGAAAATGMGEEILKSVGSFLIVELMRQGKSPTEACKEAVERIAQRNPNYENFQAAFIAINKNGEYGGYALHKGFSYAVRTENTNELIKAEFKD